MSSLEYYITYVFPDVTLGKCDVAPHRDGPHEDTSPNRGAECMRAAYAWWNHATVTMLACCALYWLACIFPSLLFKWLHVRAEEGAACIFWQSLRALDGLNAPATQCMLWRILRWHWAQKCWKYLDFWGFREKPDLNRNRNEAVSQANTGSERNGDATD